MVHLSMAMPWLRQLVTGLSLQRPGFDNSPVYVRFIVERILLDKSLSKYYQVSHITVVPPLLHTHLHLDATCTRRTNGQSSCQILGEN
jgi:hypothetical protein